MEFWKWEEAFSSIRFLPETLVPWAVYAAVRFLRSNSPSFDHRLLQERMTLESGLEATEKQAKKAKEGLLRLLEWMLANNPENEGKFTIEAILGTHSDLTPEQIDLISSSFSQVIGVIPQKPIYRGTQLIDVDFTAGFSIEPHESYIKLKLVVADAESGQESFRVVRLTVSQFKVSTRLVFAERNAEGEERSQVLIMMELGQTVWLMSSSLGLLDIRYQRLLPHCLKSPLGLYS
jgi:hypothetical protein